MVKWHFWIQMTPKVHEHENMWNYQHWQHTDVPTTSVLVWYTDFFLVFMHIINFICKTEFRTFYTLLINDVPGFLWGSVSGCVTIAGLLERMNSFRHPCGNVIDRFWIGIRIATGSFVPSVKAPVCSSNWIGCGVLTWCQTPNHAALVCECDTRRLVLQTDFMDLSVT